ncbi:hypothetical protein ACTI_70330 [Actinoplanes sp. OR16]|nr:hypothetical protein ACTI_70330 [Actinoplanes sp. OR16]
MCAHDPDCGQEYARLVDAAGEQREFRYRRFADINETMRLHGMAVFTLDSNDRRLITTRQIDEVLAAYALVPSATRAALESDPKWAAWLDWLALSRRHGGFEAE